MLRKYEGKRGVRWHVVVYDRGRRVFGGAFATQKEAKKAHAALLLLQRPENALDPLDMRLNVHLEGLKRTVGRRTWAGYHSIAENYLLPYFEGVPLLDIVSRTGNFPATENIE